jgi:hypothetical protein
MKITFLVIAFQADHTLEPCLKSIMPFGRVVAAEGPVAFWQRRGFTTSTDTTNDILDKHNIITAQGQWTEKTDEANAALALVPDDTDFVWCVDADEIWKAETIQRVRMILDEGKTDSMSFKAVSFYGGFERYMTGFEENFEVVRIQRYYPGARFTTHRPPTINASDGKPWRNHRHITHELTDEMGLRFYHYSYVFPSQMRMKAEYYAEMGGTIPDYYRRVYLPWVLGNETARSVIEDEFDGVHNWLPDRRGQCRTERFTGSHPREIELALPEMRKRFNFELEAL